MTSSRCRTRRPTGFTPSSPTPLEPRVVLSHAGHPAAHAAHAVAAVSAPPRLSPPWESFRSELNATVGVTPGVSVSPTVETATGYTVTIKANTHARGVAIASVVAPTQTFGNVVVTVRVVGPNKEAIAGVTPTSADILAAQETRAFAGNPLFQRAVVRQALPIEGSPEVVYPVFDRAVVQYFDDNIADLDNNANKVAADAFADVLDRAPGGITVNPSTASAQAGVGGAHQGRGR